MLPSGEISIADGRFSQSIRRHANPYDRSMSRVFLIGLDGLEPTLTEQWMGEGRLPNLAGLRERGAYLRCRSTTPHATFPAWTTCVTGVNPGRHGIVDFTELRHAEQRVRFVNSTYRTMPAIWNVLSNAGRRVCVLGVPATYPPEPVNGVMVSGFDSPVATAVDRSFVHPPERFAEVKAWRFADVDESYIDDQWHARAYEKIRAKLDDKVRIAVDMARSEPWDFFMVVFGESDTIAHHFWLFHDPDSPRHRAGQRDAIRTIYERLDRAVGELMDAAGDAAVAVVSDHGFGGSGTGVVHLNNWLHRGGHLEFAPDSAGILKRAALKLTPVALRGTLFRRFEHLAARAESTSRFAGIDWRRTRAWSEELNYFPSVRINLRGRDRFGVVDPLDYDSYVRDLCAELEAWEVIDRAWPRSELYDGPHVGRAPDIVLELALENGYSHSCLRSRGGEPFRRLEPHEFLGGKERGMTGNHRPEGVFFLSQPVEPQTMSLLDVAPTVYQLLGVSAPALEGASLLGRPAEAAQPHEHAAVSPYTAEQEAAIEARLRDLGYFE